MARATSPGRRTDAFRLRIGDWRVRFAVRDVTTAGENGRIIDVLRVLSRGRAYRDLP